MNLFLVSPEYRPNLSNIIRSAEFYGLKKIYLYDEHQLLSPPNNKTSRADMNHMARVWTAGAIEYMEIISVLEPLDFMREYKGRKIASVVSNTATQIYSSVWKEGDILLLGNEKYGLSSEIIELCDESVYVPHIGHTNCLNVSVSAGIFLHDFMSKLRCNQK